MRTVFFDLDGVLVDFVRGALRAHGKSLPIKDVQWAMDKQLDIPATKFWDAFGFNFWANLDPLEDGLRLLKFAEKEVGAENVGLLSSPCNTAGCIDGKREWVRKNLPDYSKRLFIGSAKELFASPQKVLVDDHDPNCDKFAAAGGQSVLVPRPWNRNAVLSDSDGNFKPWILDYQLGSILAG